MTEDEAKTKWCPHVRFHAVGANGKDFPRANAAGNRVGSVNGTDDNPVSCRCIASHCMAWRKIPMLTVQRPAYGQSIRTDEGYCGLAGKPES